MSIFVLALLRTMKLIWGETLTDTLRIVFLWEVQDLYQMGYRKICEKLMVTLLNLEYRYFQRTRNRNDQTGVCVCAPT